MITPASAPERTTDDPSRFNRLIANPFNQAIILGSMGLALFAGNRDAKANNEPFPVGEPPSQLISYLNVDTLSVAALPGTNTSEARASSDDPSARLAELYKKNSLVAGLVTTPGHTNIWLPSKKHPKFHAWIETNKRTGQKKYWFSLLDSIYGGMSATKQDSQFRLRETFPKPVFVSKTRGFYRGNPTTVVGVTYFARPK